MYIYYVSSYKFRIKKQTSKMKTSVAALMLLLTTSVTWGHKAIDCFNQGILQSGLKKNGVETVEISDKDLVLLVSKDQELTSIKVCTDRAVTFIRGVQVSYGQFNGIGEIEEDVSLNSFGSLNQASLVCSNFYIPQGDYLTMVQYRVSLLGIS